MLASTADELLLIFREEVSDKAEPYLWSDSLAYSYMTEGCDALANEAQPFYKVLRLDYTAGEAVLGLPRSVLQIRSARDVTANRPLHQANSNDLIVAQTKDYGLRSAGPSAMFESSGAVSTFVRDYEKRALRLVPIPNVSGTIEIQCTVTLTEPLSEGAPLLCTEASDQRLVLCYMKWRAYSKHDAETEDLTRAKTNENAFRLGVRDREVQLRKYRRAAGTVRMSGW